MGHPCYCRGTLIQTAHSEVAVEDLRVGDLLMTISGVARPIRWIGTRSFVGRFVTGNRDALPIRIRAGALGHNTPKRDLYVSPLHGIYLDDSLVPAGALVNEDLIDQLQTVDRVDYYHIELETHDIIIAEGAHAETFVDDYSRGMFHNFAEYDDLYPDAIHVPAQFCAPRIEDGVALEAIRERLAAHARDMRGDFGLVKLSLAG